MVKRKLKGSKKTLSALGMGCFGLGGPFMRSDGSNLAYGKVNDKESIDTIHKAIELGINLFDTADIYGVGRSEKVLGTALKGYRDDIVIATKFGSVFEEGNPLTKDGKKTSPQYIHSALEASMRRLQTDFIDIYQLHSSQHDPDDSKKVQIILEELVEEGLIGGYGWSTDDPERMEIFAKGKNCNSVQFAMNITLHNFPMIQLCEKTNLIGLIRSPLASGILTGKYNEHTSIANDHMLAGVDFSQERYKKITIKLQKLKEILKEDDRTLIQGQLGYLLAASETIIPIPGAKTVEQIEENAGTLEFGPLSLNMVNEINELFADV
ncbi:MAG: aldo/keto reductase [Promethearchaeota archaeon]|nr:MAG: aldo/keto reductase [Candidatus Lokiarchaeota archaeon]